MQGGEVTAGTFDRVAGSAFNFLGGTLHVGQFNGNLVNQGGTLAPGELGADTSLSIYHRFHHRCSGCHVAPSPRQAPADAWPRIVERMGQNIDAAGLIPLAEEDAEAITQLMQRNASKPGEPPPARSGAGDRR